MFLPRVLKYANDAIFFIHQLYIFHSNFASHQSIKWNKLKSQNIFTSHFFLPTDSKQKTDVQRWKMTFLLLNIPYNYYVVYFLLLTREENKRKSQNKRFFFSCFTRHLQLLLLFYRHFQCLSFLLSFQYIYKHIKNILYINHHNFS